MSLDAGTEKKIVSNNRVCVNVQLYGKLGIEISHPSPRHLTYEGWLKRFEPHTENEEIGRINFVCGIFDMFAHVLHSHLVGSTFYCIFPCS